MPVWRGTCPACMRKWTLDARMKAVHFIPFLGRKHGGPVFGVAAYTAGLIDAGCDVELFNVFQETDGERIRIEPRVKVITCQSSEGGAFRRCREFWQTVQMGPGTVIHSHGLWTDINRLAGALARRQRLPHLLAPCGMLAAKALGYHWWKKIPVRIWFQTRMLREASCLHAKSEEELRDIRRFGLHNPVAVIPNPVLLPPLHARMSAEEFRSTFGFASEKNILLFLGRLHQVKGVPRLIHAWAEVREFHTRWNLVLAGPNEQNFRCEFEMLAAKRGCGDSVVFLGELDDRAKWGAYSAAQIFVMPSDFENFGNSIVEAMLSGLPVVTTTGTPWKQLPAENAGWWVDPTPEALAGALREALETQPDRRKLMGEQAARLASQFHAQRVVASLLDVYRWLLEQGPAPVCVRRA